MSAVIEKLKLTLILENKMFIFNNKGMYTQGSEASQTICIFNHAFIHSFNYFTNNMYVMHINSHTSLIFK